MKPLCVIILDCAVLLAAAGCPPYAQAVLVNEITVWGETADLTPGVSGSVSNLNRLGGFGSDISYDPVNHVLWAVPDRGPDGGVLPFNTRLQKFQLDVDPVTGAMSNFQLLATIPFKTADGSQNFDGRTPANLNGNPSVLGRSLDPEGLVVTNSGKVYVSDEYGPSLYEFNLVDQGGATEARFLRSFTVPARYTPKDSTGAVNYDATTSTTPAVVSGRQSGRGFEGLTISPDGARLYTIMQDPLVHEGDRRGRYVRIAQYEVATGQASAEYLYPLESVASINLRVPDAPFTATQQGRNISANGILALPNGKFLVLERDNRGIGTANPLNTDPVLSRVGTKRVYEIDLAGATPVDAIDLPTNGSLPAGVVPVNKNPVPVLDVDQTLRAAGLNVAEKLEGISLVPLAGPQPLGLLVAADNDFGVLEGTATPPALPPLFDVYTDGTTAPMDSPVPPGVHILPSRLYAFAVPEPSAYVLLLTGGAFVLAGGWWRHRSNSHVQAVSEPGS